MLRVISELKPTWVLGENVPGIIPIFLDQAISDLEAEGYSCEAIVLPACAFDAPHRRDRLFIVAHTKQPNNRSKIKREETVRQNSQRPTSWVGGSSDGDRERNVANANGKGLEIGQSAGRTYPAVSSRSRWAVEPSVGRVAHGISARVHRLRGLGNAVVPQVAEFIGRQIINAHSK